MEFQDFLVYLMYNKKLIKDKYNQLSLIFESFNLKKIIFSYYNYLMGYKINCFYVFKLLISY